MTRPRQKQEGKRKGYGKFLPVRKPPLFLFQIYERVQGSEVQVWRCWADSHPGAHRLAQGIGIKSTRAVEVKFESAQKAAGKEGR